jgi:transposase, IS5 family
LEYLLFPHGFDKDTTTLLFEQDTLGKIHAQIPFKQLAKKFEVFSPPGSSLRGRSAHLDVKGGLGLMFLKHYLKLSDKKLIERLNTDVYLQLFCFTRIPLNKPIRDKDLVGRWRRFFGRHLDIHALQDELAQHWQGHLKQTSILMDDATCYTSAIKYPTDIKLLFDCCQWLYGQMLELCQTHELKQPRIDKYQQMCKRVGSFQRMKRKRRKKEKRLRKSLLYWLDKWQGTLQELLDRGKAMHEGLTKTFYKRLKVIRIIYHQQSYMYRNNVRKVAHRIVSLYKPYLRPIVRGKERKPCEFGAKVHVSQVDGLNFIEHLNFEAFHEGNRMWNSIARHKRRFGKCTHYAADRIYATNRNRRKAKKLDIKTCFKRKGPKAKDEPQREKLRKALANQRATRLEGSFGTEKQHYLAERIRARTQATEVAWIYFAMHTANVVRLAKRLEKTKRPRAA